MSKYKYKIDKKKKSGVQVKGKNISNFTTLFAYLLAQRKNWEETTKRKNDFTFTLVPTKAGKAQMSSKINNLKKVYKRKTLRERTKHAKYFPNSINSLVKLFTFFIAEFFENSFGGVLGFLLRLVNAGQFLYWIL